MIQFPILDKERISYIIELIKILDCDSAITKGEEL